MVQREADTVEGYLKAVPEDRRPTIRRVLEFVRRHLPDGFEEGINYGMIGWFVPLDRYPDTYNGQPLGVVSLAAQKHHNALYLMGPYAIPELDARIRKAYADAGKKLDMGKSCLRFKQFDELETGVLAEVLEAVPPERFIELYEASRRGGARRTGRR